MLEHIDIKNIVKIAERAGLAIMNIYQQDFSIHIKADKSPLTEADIESNEIICKGLKEAYPDIPVLSEEGRDIPYGQRKSWEYFWLIDPIDGTKEFIKKTGEFTVNIALIHHDEPVLGVVHVPVTGDTYWAKQGIGAYKDEQKLPIVENDQPDQHMVVVASLSHPSPETEAFIESLPATKITKISKGSSLKLCMVAEGIADVYPRLAPTMEWDTAAAHAVVLESGKKVVQYENNQPLIYNKENLLNPWFVVA